MDQRIRPPEPLTLADAVPECPRVFRPSTNRRYRFRRYLSLEAHSEKKGDRCGLVQEMCRTSSSSVRDRLGALSTDDCLMRATVWSEHLLAVQLAEWIGD